MKDAIRAYRAGQGTETYVSCGSKEAKLLSSIPERCCLERTRLLLSYDEYDGQCYGSLTDLAGRAICGGFPKIGFLEEY